MALVNEFHIIYRISILLLVSFLAACSVEPDNLEPDMDILDVYDITRTRATVSFRVQKYGSAKLSYLSLYYGEPGKTMESLPLTDLDREVYVLDIVGLSAGRTYECYVLGGTASATITSRKVQFSTLPNVVPTVSHASALSTGPMGVIVEFEILEDGGEQILAAGCDVTDHSAATTTRVELNRESLAVGKHRLNIVGLSVNTSYSITSFAANSIGEVNGDPLEITTTNSIVLKSPGSLASLFDINKPFGLEKISIAGDMNGDDFRFLRLMLGAPLAVGAQSPLSTIPEVDLAGVNIISGGGSFDGQRYLQDNVISTGLFADCKALKTIVLPASAISLERDALARCTALTSLTVPAAVQKLLPSAGCSSLESIDVSPANTAYASLDGVLFNSDVTEILWFPLGKTGEYVLPATVAVIGENAFYGTSITSLNIPPSVVKISRGAFAGSSLVDIILPDNLTNISEAMFQNCNSLTTVHLGRGTEFVGNYAFDGTGLKDLYLSASIPPYTNSEAFYNRAFSLFKECTLHVPASSKAIYRNHRQWGLFDNIVEL